LADNFPYYCGWDWAISVGLFHLAKWYLVVQLGMEEDWLGSFDIVFLCKFNCLCKLVLTPQIPSFWPCLLIAFLLCNFSRSCFLFGNLRGHLGQWSLLGHISRYWAAILLDVYIHHASPYHCNLLAVLFMGQHFPLFSWFSVVFDVFQ